MDINIIISGNLTGFTTFYATPNANGLYADAKFDFDYRNFVTFLNNGEKAYVISFAPNVVSVSLITRILDSFRRPGILVVSTLLQKGMIVDSLMNPGDKNALYQFLNEINDKFYERNFMNGMINQNAAVLMQDYYSDILSNYRLTSEYNQRKINGNIDITTPNKRLGYIAANDIDMPLYLSSLYRRSYEGFHHVFFAANAPQNIEETPEEVAMYRVYITNNRMTLPAMVKLTDQIYRLNPGEGEIPFDQNYTYGEVLEGKAGSQIRASIVGETLEVSYRFKEEEKTINFIFEDRGNIIPLASIAPVIHDTDGTSYNLSSDTFKFIGKEIYGKKILKSTNTNFIIKPESSTLDLLRLNNGATCHVQVESCFVLNYKFQIPYNVPKKITIYRKDTNQSYTITDVTDSIYKEIPGNLNEWDYVIESKEYITLTGNLGDLQSIKFSPKPISNTSIRTTLPATGSTQQLVFDSNQFKKGAIKLSNGSDSKKGQSDNRKLNIKKVLLVTLPLLVVSVGLIIWSLIPGDKDKTNPDEPYVEKTDLKEKKKITITLLDCKGDIVYDDPKYKENIGIKPYLEDVECYVHGDIEKDVISKENTIILNASENCEDKVEFKLQFDNITICDTIFAFNDITDGSKINLKLDVLTSAIILYKKIYTIVENGELLDNNKWKEYSDKIKKNTDEIVNPNQEFRKNLEDLFKRVKKKDASVVNPNKPLNKKLDETTITYNDLKDFKISENDSLKEQLKERLDLLKNTLKNLRKGKLPINSNGFSKVPIKSSIYKCDLSQKDIIDALIATKEKLGEEDYGNKLLLILKDKNNNDVSLHQAYEIVKNHNESIYKGKK